jgi:hypothetical protein
MKINQQQYRSNKVKSRENLHILSKPLLANITLLQIEPFKAPDANKMVVPCAMSCMAYRLRNIPCAGGPGGL